MKRVVISDIHIGSKYYRGELLAEFLNDIEYDQLILAGDIIDFIRIPEFTMRAVEIKNAIDYSKEIIYIVGNHETPLKGLIGKEAFGIKFMDRYEFEEAGRRFRIEHGDAYDQTSFIHNNIVMAFLSISQSYIESLFSINLSNLYTDYKIKRRKLRRIWDILKVNSDVDVFICGHFHIPEAIIWINEEKRISTYVNSGDWQFHSSYVRITDGVVRLESYKSKKDKNRCELLK